MKQTFASLGRFTIIGSVALSVATVSNFLNYHKYWNGTIFAVQTVDFNILSHTLPTKLSILLTQGNKKEIQRTLNSNYGLFGMVVTDCQTANLKCSNQKILYSSKSSYRWKQQLQVNNWQNHPYDLLRNPPPVYAEGHFNNIYIRNRQPTGQTNSGAIIGRIYYVRNKPPTFIQDYTRWMRKPWSLSGANAIYTLTVALFLLGGFSSWRVLERVLHQKRVQQELARQEREELLAKQEQLLNQAQSLQQQLQEKIQQTQVLLEQREGDRTELERYQEKQEQHTHQLEQTIAQYETQLAQQEEQQRDNAQALKQLQQELADFQQWEVAALSEIQQREQAIATLQYQIDAQEKEKQQKVELLEVLRQDFQNTKARESKAQHQVERLNQMITALSSERDQALQKSHELEQFLVEVPNVDELSAALEAARTQMEQVRELEEYAVEENEQLKSQNEQLIQKYNDAQLQILALEEQVEFYLKYLAKPPLDRAREEAAVFNSEFETVLEAIDLSGLRLALVGGHPDTRREVIRELCENYRLQDYVEIAPSSEAYLSRSSVRAKIGNCDLIVEITGYMGHDLSRIVSELKRDGALNGQVLLLNREGRSGIVREIINHVKSKLCHKELIANTK